MLRSWNSSMTIVRNVDEQRILLQPRGQDAFGRDEQPRVAPRTARSNRTCQPTSRPSVQPRSSAIRRAIARAATRRGCSRSTGPSVDQRRRHARRLARARRRGDDDARERARDERRTKSSTGTRRSAADIGHRSSGIGYRSSDIACRHRAALRDSDELDTQTESMTDDPIADARADNESDVLPRRPARRRRHGADDEGIEPAVPAALHRAGRARARERDGRRAPAEAAAARRVRADPPRAGRAVLRRAARRQQARGDGVGRGARRSARRGLRRSQPRLPDRSLHAHGPRRGARPPAESRAAHRRGDARGGEGAGHRQDSARLERATRATTSTLARAAVDGGAAAITVHGRTREARYRHPADWDAIAEVAAAVPVPVVGNGDLLFAHEIRERLATSGCAGGDDRARRADQAVDLPRSRRRATGTSPPKSGSRSTGATSSWRGHWRRDWRRRPTSTAARGSASSCAGTSGSGAATRRSGRTARGRRCSSASPRSSRDRRSKRCSRAPTTPRSTTSPISCWTAAICASPPAGGRPRARGGSRRGRMMIALALWRAGAGWPGRTPQPPPSPPAVIVRGVVVDATTNAPIADARVALVELGRDDADRARTAASSSRDVPPGTLHADGLDASATSSCAAAIDASPTRVARSDGAARAKAPARIRRR